MSSCPFDVYGVSYIHGRKPENRPNSSSSFSFLCLLCLETREPAKFLTAHEDDAVTPDLIHLAMRSGDMPQSAHTLLVDVRYGYHGRPQGLQRHRRHILQVRRSPRCQGLLLLHDMPANGVTADTKSYSLILAALARRGQHCTSLSCRYSRTSPPSPLCVKAQLVFMESFDEEWRVDSRAPVTA